MISESWFQLLNCPASVHRISVPFLHSWNVYGLPTDHLILSIVYPPYIYGVLNSICQQYLYLQCIQHMTSQVWKAITMSWCPHLIQALSRPKLWVNLGLNVGYPQYLQPMKKKTHSIGMDEVWISLVYTCFIRGNRTHFMQPIITVLQGWIKLSIGELGRPSLPPIPSLRTNYALEWGEDPPQTPPLLTPGKANLVPRMGGRIPPNPPLGTRGRPILTL